MRNCAGESHVAMTTPLEKASAQADQAMTPQQLEETVSAGISLEDFNDETLCLVYEHIREIALRFRVDGFHSDSYAATELVQETLSRMLGGMPGKVYESHRHVLNTASKVMYRMLIERLRRRKLRQRALDELFWKQPPASQPAAEVAAEIRDEFSALESRRPVAAEALRFSLFFQMTIDEIAAAMGTSRTTAHRELAFARAFLKGLKTDAVAKTINPSNAAQQSSEP